MSMTVDQLKQALPRNLQHNASQEFADKINAIAGDPEIAREVRENFLTYSRVLQDGKYKTEDYLNAVTYCTFKLMGLTNKDAYVKSFPDRYQALVARGATEKEISAYVAMYHKNKLVNTILEQAFIPMWLLNQDAYQRAINTQLEIMDDALAPHRDRTAAANSLLTHLKQPETKKVELEMSVKSEGGIADLRATMSALAERQLELINAGAGAKLIGAQPMILEASVRDITPVPAPVPPPPVIGPPSQLQSLADSAPAVALAPSHPFAELEEFPSEDNILPPKPERQPDQTVLSLWNQP